MLGFGRVATDEDKVNDRLGVSSPEGVNRIEVWQTGDGVQYSVVREGQQIIAASRLGLEMDNEQWEHALAQYYMQYDSWMQGFSVDSVTYSQHREMLHPLGFAAWLVQEHACMIGRVVTRFNFC